MAGSSLSYTVTTQNGQYFGSQYKLITFTWVSDDTTGAVSGTTTEKFSGRVVQLTTDPSGTAAPTDNYDIVLTDSRGGDVLNATGANRSTSLTQLVTGAVGTPFGIVFNSTLTLAVTNAGNSKEGVVYVLLQVL